MYSARHKPKKIQGVAYRKGWVAECVCGWVAKGEGRMDVIESLRGHADRMAEAVLQEVET